MGFNFGAFAAGFGEGAAKTIETRNTEIRKGALSELDRLVGDAEKKEKGYRTERNELTQMATQLAEFRGSNNTGFTETQILGLLQQPETAKTIITELKTKKNLEEVDFGKIFKPEEGGTAMKPQDYIAKKTSVVKAEGGPTPVVRTAFGLESPALRQAEASFEATTGRKVADVRGVARGAVDLGEDFKPTVGTLDLGQFGNPESLSTVQNKLRDSIANGEPLSSEGNKKLLTKLRADATIKTMFEGDGEGGKPRTTSAINSVFDKSLRAGLDPFVVKGVVRFDPQTNDYVPITGDTKAIGEFMDHKNKLIQNQAKALGILDKDNNVVGGRNAADALLPYANIEEGKVTSWKSAPVKVETAEPTAPKVGAPSSVTEKPITIPKTADGKIDGTKLVPGQTYTDAQGKKKTWNGTSFQ